MREYIFTWCNLMAESPLRRILVDFSRIEGVRGAIVVSMDGFPIEAIVPGGGIDLEALAAMVVTIYGAAKRFGDEFNLGDTEILTSEYAGGTLLIQKLREAVFAVVADKTAILGRIRYEMKRQKPRIEAAL